MSWGPALMAIHVCAGADTAQLTSLPAADTILYKVMYTKTPSGLLPVLVPAGTQ